MYNWPIVSDHKRWEITRKEERAEYGIHEDENLKYKRRGWQPTKEVDSPNGFSRESQLPQASDLSIIMCSIIVSVTFLEAHIENWV